VRFGHPTRPVRREPRTSSRPFERRHCLAERGGVAIGRNSPLVGKATKAGKPAKAKGRKPEAKAEGKAAKAKSSKAEAVEAKAAESSGTTETGDAPKKESFKGIRKLFGGGKGGKKAGGGVKAAPSVNKRSGSRGGGE
jgi:membrane protein involved in colicin uptake